MPDLYAPGHFDLAGFCVGVVELKRVQKPARVRAGDVVLALASSGIHSNGYTLVRSVVKQAGLDLKAIYPELASANRRRSRTTAGPTPPLGEVLLTPTRIYASSIVKLMRAYTVKNVITGMANITGSGIPGNLCRALPPTLDAEIRRGSWDVPPVFTFLQNHGKIDDAEMERVFNLGVGYCLIVKPAFADAVADRLRRLGERVSVIGRIVKGSGTVRLV
jgi:phosphoribosylformylglycinamidine cyclo-ligase